MKKFDVAYFDDIAGKWKSDLIEARNYDSAVKKFTKKFTKEYPTSVLNTIINEI